MEPEKCDELLWMSLHDVKQLIQKDAIFESIMPLIDMWEQVAQ